MTLVPAGYKECVLIWGSSGEMYMEQPPGYAAQGRIKFVASRRLSMASSKVHGCGLRTSALPSLTLVFTSVTQITLPSFGIQILAS